MANRMGRDEFHERLQGLDQAALKKLLWTLYWRGTAQVRERIEGLLGAETGSPKERAAPAPSPGAVLAEIKEFAVLARAGAYLGLDRRVLPRERTRWRYTFRRLAGDAEGVLRGPDVDTGVAALSLMIDLACESIDREYFRSDDPMEAARFVVSDAVALIWARLRDVHGAAHVAALAPHHLVRWESQYGWTRRGYGWVAERESTLASKLTVVLVVPDLWSAAAFHYLDALDQRPARSSGRCRPNRADLKEWNRMLADHLVGCDDEELLGWLASHPALTGQGFT